MEERRIQGVQESRSRVNCLRKKTLEFLNPWPLSPNYKEKNLKRNILGQKLKEQELENPFNQ
jgi:hypothetical protein